MARVETHGFVQIRLAAWRVQASLAAVAEVANLQQSCVSRAHAYGLLVDISRGTFTCVCLGLSSKLISLRGDESVAFLSRALSFIWEEIPSKLLNPYGQGKQ